MWGLTLRPDVAIRAKRWFPRADQDRTGLMILQQTPDVARDLDAFLARYPLDATPHVMAQIAEMAEAHRATERQVADILAGYTPPLAGREPARPLRGYQQQAVALSDLVPGFILGDDLGLGKSTSGIGMLLRPDRLPAVVVVPTHIQKQWLRELNTVAPWLLGHIVTKGTPYDASQRRDCGGRTPDVWIITYSKLAGWADYFAGRARTLICDEVQELRRGTDSQKGKAAARIAAACVCRAGLSATPVFNHGDEAWEIYDILSPGRLGSRDEFLREWGGGVFGRSHTVKDPEALGRWLRAEGLLLRRTRRDVHRELPDPILITEPVDTDRDEIDRAAQDAAEFARLLLDTDTDVLERGRAAQQIDWRMRRATGVAKAPFVAGFVNLLLESEEKVVLAGWHRDVYAAWLDALAPHKPVMYTGTESSRQKDESVKAFMEGDSRVLILSLRSGAGLDGLQKAASVVVFGELDWSPGMHEQVIGRLHRDGQDATVVAYFLMSDSGTDPLMAEALQVKEGQSRPLMDPDRPLMSPVGGADVDRSRTLARHILDRAAAAEQEQAGQGRLDADWLLYGQTTL